MLVILSIQWGYPFRNLQHAPKAEKVEYRMVLLVFGGLGEGRGRLWTSRGSEQVSFSALGCSLSPSWQRMLQPAHPEWSRHLLLHHAFLPAATLPCHGSHGIKPCEAISPKQTHSFMCFLVHSVLAQQRKSH